MGDKDDFNLDDDFKEGNKKDSDDDFDYSGTGGEPVENRESIVNNIFDTKNRIKLLKHRLRGDIDQNGVWDPTEHALAPESFINKQIGAMESIIDTVNSFSKKDDKECKRILHEANKAFILDMGNEPDIDPKDFRTLAKSYEHSLELFLGLVEFGHGANVLTKALAGVAGDFDNNKNKGGPFGWLNR